MEERSDDVRACGDWMCNQRYSITLRVALGGSQEPVQSDWVFDDQLFHSSPSGSPSAAPSAASIHSHTSLIVGPYAAIKSARAIRTDTSALISKYRSTDWRKVLFKALSSENVQSGVSRAFRYLLVRASDIYEALSPTVMNSLLPRSILHSAHAGTHTSLPYRFLPSPAKACGTT